MDVCDEHREETVVADSSPVMYRRPLDRTADKSFNKLSDNDKLRLSTLRSALEEAKSRIVQLRDTNDQKDYIIHEERQLRQATEENLQKYLVDIYNNPDVNSELYLRLPHARRAYTSYHNPETLSGSPQLTSVQEDTNALQRNNVNRRSENVDQFSDKIGPATTMDLENRLQHSAAYRSDLASLSQPVAGASGGSLEAQFLQTHQNTTQQSVRPIWHKPHLPDSHFTNRHLEDPPDGYNLEGRQETEVWSALKSVYQLLPPYISPAIYTNPLSPVDWSSRESSVYQDLPRVHKQKDQQGKEQESRSRREKNEQTLPTAGTQTLAQDLQAPNTSRLPEPRLLISSHSTSLPSLHNIDNPGPSMPTTLYSHYLPYSTSRHGSAPYGADPVSHTSRLLVEIATLKRENEELQEKLRGARLEVELLSNNRKSAEDLSLNRIGALIEEIHNAEKKRNMAVEMLMGAADKDKTDSLEEEKQLKKKYVSKSVQADVVYGSEFSEAEDYEDEPTSTSESAMTDTGNSTQKVLHKQNHIEQLVSRQREIMKEEMQKVLDERNEARQRVTKLEKKLASLELSHFTDNRASALLTKLRVTERERDLAVSRLKFLAHDVNETKLMYNLHKALLSDDPTNHTSTYQEFKKSNLDIDHTKHPMTSILSKETDEKAKLEARIAFIEKDKRSQARHIEKLEQLVKRQRQKLNSLCAGPMLMDND